MGSGMRSKDRKNNLFVRPSTPRTRRHLTPFASTLRIIFLIVAQGKQKCKRDEKKVLRNGEEYDKMRKTQREERHNDTQAPLH